MANPEKIITQLQDVDKTTNEVTKIFYPETVAEAVSLADGTQLPDKLAELEISAANGSYSNDTPIVSAIGGITVGETFTDETIPDMLTKLLYPYVKPTISLSSTISAGYKEIGTSIEPTLVATAIKKSSNISSVKIYRGGDIIANITDGTLTASAVAAPVTESTTFSATVTDANSSVVSSNNIAYTFVYPFYAGVSADANPIAADIIAMTKVVTGKSNQTHSFTVAGERMVCACPPNWIIASIIDPNGFNITASFTAVTVNLGTVEVPVEYTVYVSGVTTQTGFVVTFNAA